MADKHYHQRVVVLHYSDSDLPRPATPQELERWHAAVGRTVLYGLQRDATEDVVDLVSVCTGPLPDGLLAQYHGAVPGMPRDALGNLQYRGSHEEQIDALHAALAANPLVNGRRAFVIGGILNDDGTWGFHS